MLMVNMQPRSERPGMRSLQDLADRPRPQIALAEAASDGETNAAVCALLAERLRGPGTSVGIVAAVTSRERQLLVEGDAVALIEKPASL